MRISRLATVGAAVGLSLALAAPVSALGHPLHVQKSRDDGPAAVTIGEGRGNPKGSNGTIKIDGVDADGFFDGHPNNEPHIGGCVFQTDFYGFDEGDIAEIGFRLWPPSGMKTPLVVFGFTADPANGPFDDGLGLHPVAVSADGTRLVNIDVGGDGAGGGIDIDNQIYVVLDLPDTDPGAGGRHGYHVRADAEITSGKKTIKKTKVFWVSGDCEPSSLS